MKWVEPHFAKHATCHFVYARKSLRHNAEAHPARRASLLPVAPAL
jgi:hypothetical protein